MAEESFYAIEWNTQVPSHVFDGSSCVFEVLGVTWKLELEPLFDHKPLGCSLSLLRIGNERPSTHFSVITFIHKTDSVKDGSHFQSHGHKQTIKKEITTLGAYPIENTKGTNVPAFAVRTRVTVVCGFSVFPSTTSGIPNETVEVMTQTDFDCLLSVNNIHDVKLSSDRCEQGSSNLSSNLDSLSRDLGKLLEDKVVPDVNLSCGGQKIAAHKAILAARSQVFSAMFQSRMQESETGVVDIADVDVQVIEMFLKYVYSGKLSDLSDELLPSLYAAADKYAVSSLITICSQRMISNLTRENCLDVLLLANAHSDQDLKNAVINFILNQMEILKSQEWVRFSKENPILSVEVLQAVVQRKCF